MNRPAALLILTFFITCALALPARAQSASEIFKASLKLESDGQPLDAVVLVEKGLASFPGDIPLLILHARLQDNRAGRGAAIAEMRALRDRYPDDDTVLTALGFLYEYSGMVDSSLVLYRRCLALADNQSDSLGANINIGTVYGAQRRFDLAVQHYEKMLPRYQDSVAVLNNLANAYAKTGNQEKAIQLLRQVVLKNPHAPLLYNNLGMALTEAARYGEAALVFQQGLEVDPGLAVLHNNYGYILYKQEKYPQALGSINRSIEIATTNPYAYRNRALVYFALGLETEACRDLEASAAKGFSTYYGPEVDSLRASRCGVK